MIHWFSDLHLDFIEDGDITAFFENQDISDNDIVLISGDISVSDKLHKHLELISSVIKCRTAFVLGNHDYYNSSIHEVNSNVKGYIQEYNNLVWLTDHDFISINNNVAVIGHEGWADGMLGNYFASNVNLTDYIAIEDFSGLAKYERLNLLNQLGDNAAGQTKHKLNKAFMEHDKVIFVTHVPPFKNSCWHQGEISNDDFLPHFSCKAMGDMLLEKMAEREGKELVVLCGHTHSSGFYLPAENIKVYTAAAEYGTLQIQADVFS